MSRHESESLAVRVLNGDVKAAARLITLMEDGSPEALVGLEELYRHPGRAHVVGITGAPGVGKSTLTGALIGRFRRQNVNIGVIAIDPSSPLTGGALLGDRIRMQQHSADPSVFIRSLAARGWSGGLARAALGAIRVMDALGKDIILVETVGSGQQEMDIVKAADTTLLVLAPGAGDEIQTMKAGILEAADILVVNKADIAGADHLKAHLEAMLAVPEHPPEGWIPPVLLTEALHDRAIDKLAERIQKHHEYLVSGGGIQQHRRERARLELLDAVADSVKNVVERIDANDYLNKLLDDFLSGRTDFHKAYLKIIERLAHELDHTGAGGSDGI
jgi:LAO/AO transport system kinase